MDIFPKIKGTIIDYDLIVIGHLKWNRYFNEGPQDPPRGDPSTCTSVLIRGRQENGKEYVLIVDPTLRKSPEDYYFDINRRTGLLPKDITHLFCTHHHGDHVEGISYFKDAKCYMPKGVLEDLGDNKIRKEFGISTAEGEFLPGIYALSLPGHTKNLHGIAFSFGGKRILIAGDAVMTKNHFVAGTTEFQDDPKMREIAAVTISNIKESFDIVIPGHDNILVIDK